ncbi:MAG TPA: hypothetical protein VFT56_12990 [Sphingomonas sp.]|nr:hypothetical protein [Sphingomonas sp.]
MFLPVVMLLQVVPPPVAITTRATLPPRTAPASATAPALFDVEVSAGGERLWTGQMRTAADVAATYTRTTVDAPPERCPAGIASYETSYRTSLQISLGGVGSGVLTTFRLRVSWERPSDGRDCANRGTQTTSRSEVFDLAPGATHVATGDGGLVVRLVRRQ